MKVRRVVQPARHADASRGGHAARPAEPPRPATSALPPRPLISARWKIAGLLAAILLTGAVALRVLPIAVAQDAGQDEAPAPKPAPKPAAQAAAVAPVQAVQPPSAEQIVVLVRSALLTLNDALRTGNYSVLHAVAAPGFQASNSPEKLAQVFAQLASQHLDLSPAAILKPEFVSVPTVDAQNMLRIKGYFPGQVQLNFEFLFQPVAGQWRMFGLAVNATAGKVAVQKPAPVVAPVAEAEPLAAEPVKPAAKPAKKKKAAAAPAPAPAAAPVAETPAQ